MATPSQIAEASACINNCIPDGAKWAAIIYQLGRLTGVTDPATIMAGAACYDSCLPQGAKLAAIIYLLDTFISGGGGLGSVLCGATDPVAAPSGSCAIYYQTVSQALYAWDGAAWILKA